MTQVVKLKNEISVFVLVLECFAKRNLSELLVQKKDKIS